MKIKQLIKKDPIMGKSRLLSAAVLGGASIIAMMSICGPSLAQEAGTPITPAADAVTGKASEKAPIIAEDGSRVADPAIEPSSTMMTSALDGSGIISAQELIGQDILLLDRQIKRAEMISNLIGYLGEDAFRAQFPELAETLAESPMLLKSELERQKILNDLEAAKNITAAPVEVASNVEGSANSLDGLAAGNGPQVRDDGSALFVPDAIKAAAAAIAQQNAALAQQVPPPAPPEDIPVVQGTPADVIQTSTTVDQTTPTAEPVVADVPISLREIYGSAGNFSAVILLGDERIRVNRGDVLPSDTTVEYVGEDYIKVKRHGEMQRYEIRG